MPEVLKLSALKQTPREGGGWCLSCRVDVPGHASAVLFHEYAFSGKTPLTEVYDTFLIAALPIAMKLGLDLHVEGRCSEGLLQNSRGPLHDYLLSRYSTALHSVKIFSETDSSESAPAAGAGYFFSGGVDSFYLLLKGIQAPRVAARPTHLLTVHGFDVSVDQKGLFDSLGRMSRRVAERHGLSYCEILTNIRLFSDRYLDWRMYHGCAIASVGMGLAGALGSIYIASAPGQEAPRGSLPELDPLWGASRILLVHDDEVPSRLEKTAFISPQDGVLRDLRVCWTNTGGTYNCSVCEKCLRTMVCLYFLGMHRQATGFDWRGLPEKVLKIYIPYFCRPGWSALIARPGPAAVALRVSIFFALLKSWATDVYRATRDQFASKRVPV